MKYGVIVDRVFMEHENPPGHPERPERIEALLPVIDALGDRIARYPPVGLDDSVLARVHRPEHVDEVRRTAGRPPVAFDPDTYAGEESHETARLAAGSAVRLVDLLFQGEIEAGMLLARPPGHHAESGRAMGFCLFNNVAVATQWALDRGIADRVAVVDFDVHHGNGTQEIFYGRRDVLYMSSHQYPFYPGTGAFGEIGMGEGAGFTVNFPVSAGRGNSFFAPLYREMVVPILRQYRPDLILVSAGYDAHVRDPLAGMKMTDGGFGRLAVVLNETAGEVCRGRILYILEGGYDLEALAGSVTATIEATLEPGQWLSPEGPPPDPELPTYLERARNTLGPYWDL
jgi:acetoin utilization deacetylase AcuC-like enzyme